MEPDDSLSKNGLLLSNVAEAESHFFADGVHGVAGAKLFNDLLERFEFFVGSYLANDETPVLSFAGVPADKDELLHRERVTCSLYLMICTCLKAK
jgi:hypothetical protein